MRCTARISWASSSPPAMRSGSRRAQPPGASPRPPPLAREVTGPSSAPSDRLRGGRTPGRRRRRRRAAQRRAAAVGAGCLFSSAFATAYVRRIKSPAVGSGSGARGAPAAAMAALVPPPRHLHLVGGRDLHHGLGAQPHDPAAPICARVQDRRPRTQLRLHQRQGLGHRTRHERFELHQIPLKTQTHQDTHRRTRRRSQGQVVSTDSKCPPRRRGR